MSDERNEQPDETQIEDLPREPMSEEEQSKVKGGSFDLGNIAGSINKAVLPTAQN
jgi:hypothetical protein